MLQIDTTVAFVKLGHILCYATSVHQPTKKETFNLNTHK